MDQIPRWILTHWICQRSLVFYFWSPQLILYFTRSTHQPIQPRNRILEHHWPPTPQPQPKCCTNPWSPNPEPTRAFNNRPQVSSFLIAQTRVSPSLTTPRESPVTAKSESSSKPETEEPSPKQEDLRTVAPTVAPGTPVDPQQQEFETLATLVEHVLDIEEREPEYPAYLHLVQQAVAIRVNILPPPPLVQPAPQINIMAQPAAASTWL